MPDNDSDEDFAGRVARDLRAMKEAISWRARGGACKGTLWVMLALQLASTQHLAEMLGEQGGRR